MTISEAKNILAEAVVPESFSEQVGIYDLQEFLNVLSLVDRPRVRFQASWMDIGSQSGRELVKYSYADTEMLTTPSKPIDMPEADVWFTIDEATSAVIKRAAAIFDHSQLAIEPDGGSIKLSVVDPDNATANQYTVQVDGGYDMSLIHI